METIMRVAEPLEWAQCTDVSEKAGENRWTTCFFGESGAGKSTALSLLAAIYATDYKDCGAAGSLPAVFENCKSTAGVTQTVQIKATGNAVLIDTPGTNDPSSLKSDKDHQSELVERLTPLLTRETEGISSFVQCIMPTAAARIESTSIESMNRVILALTILYKDADVENHPRMLVLINNLSRATLNVVQKNVTFPGLARRPEGDEEPEAIYW